MTTLADELRARAATRWAVAYDHDQLFNACADELDSLKVQLDTVSNELEESDASRSRMRDILHATADALHGGPLEDGYWSWHDLPELAQGLLAELAALKARLADSETIRRALMEDLSRQANADGSAHEDKP